MCTTWNDLVVCEGVSLCMRVCVSVSGFMCEGDGISVCGCNGVWVSRCV